MWERWMSRTEPVQRKRKKHEAGWITENGLYNEFSRGQAGKVEDMEGVQDDTNFNPFKALHKVQKQENENSKSRDTNAHTSPLKKNGWHR